MRTIDSLSPQQMRNWFLEVLNRQGQWSRAWSCTKCGAELTRRVTVNNTYQCLADVTCGKAQSRICENRRLKRGKHQQPETAGAWGTGCGEGDAQQHMGLGKRGAGDQSPKRSNCCEASAGGRHEQGMLDRCSMTEGAREPRSAGGAVGAARAERRSTGMEGGDSDIEDRKPKDTAPQEWSKDGQRPGTQQQPLPGQAVGSERGATETPGAAKAPSRTTSGARNQAIHRKVFHVGIKGQQCTQAQTKCALCALWGARLLADAKSSSFVCNVRCLRRWALNQLVALRTQAPTHERVGGCGDMEMTDGENLPPYAAGAQGESAPVSLNPPTKHVCAGCEAEGPTCPCTRCWEVWYCSDECAQMHWCQHQTQCRAEDAVGMSRQYGVKTATK